MKLKWKQESEWHIITPDGECLTFPNKWKVKRHLEKYPEDAKEPGYVKKVIFRGGWHKTDVGNPTIGLRREIDYDHTKESWEIEKDHDWEEVI